MKKLPKWSPCSHRGVFLGYSPEHSSSVGLVLKPTTGHVSPQCHLVYNDIFSTIPNAKGGVGFELSNFNQDTWDCLVSTGHEHHLEPIHSSSDPSLSLADEWSTDAELHACAIHQ